MRYCLVLISSFLLLSCASSFTQKGIDLSAVGSYAIIHTPSEKRVSFLSVNFGPQIVFTSLNGRSLSDFIKYQRGHPEKLHIKGGLQKLEFRYMVFGGWYEGCLWLEAIEGREYLIKRKLKGYSAIFWFEDIDSKEKVGGVCGSELELKDNE